MLTRLKINRQQKGVTLVELLIVTVIIAIVAGIGVPNMIDYMPRIRLNGAARQIMTDMVVTRMNAVRQNCKAEIKFNTSGTYEIWVDANRNNSKDAGEVTTKNIKDNYSDVNITRAITIVLNSRGVATTWGYTKVTNSKGSKDIYMFMGGHARIF
ncbi:MAG: GspH/FimT family pseudopilin [Desulfatibacillaceae bacterium]|nr:GspH/FimT family pseudopilin [Desulfatibacillaceae bacterium]